MEYLVYAATVYTLVIVTWIFYLAVMSLKRHRDQLSGIAKFFGTQILIIGLTVDVLLNWIGFTVMYLELPRELTVTSRLKRHKNKSNFRGTMSRWFCKNLLDRFDPSGSHCGD